MEETSKQKPGVGFYFVFKERVNKSYNGIDNSFERAVDEAYRMIKDRLELSGIHRWAFDNMHHDNKIVDRGVPMYSVEGHRTGYTLSKVKGKVNASRTIDVHFWNYENTSEDTIQYAWDGIMLAVAEARRLSPKIIIHATCIVLPNGTGFNAIDHSMQIF